MAVRTTVRWYGREISAKLHAAAGNGLYEAAEELLLKSGEEVPHDEGDLERSGRTDINRRALRAWVSYDTPYAIVQHEDRTLRHPPYLGTERKAKYLEDPTNEHGKRLMEWIAKRIREAHG